MLKNKLTPLCAAIALSFSIPTLAEEENKKTWQVNAPVNAPFNR